MREESVEELLLQTTEMFAVAASIAQLQLEKGYLSLNTPDEYEAYIRLLSGDGGRR